MVNGASFLELPEKVLVTDHAAGAVLSSTVFVSVPYRGLAGWADMPAGGAVIDLRLRDPASITAADFASPGPWDVWVDGENLTELLARVRAAIDGCSTAPNPLTVVAHGLAGGAAREIASDANPGFAALVAVSTPSSATQLGAALA